jgi:hypothetical protein
MNQNLFQISPSLLPKRKKRGLRRYYRKLIENAENYSIIKEPDHWFDYWHYHIDERNTSNRSWKNRKLHLKALCIIFHRIAKEAKALNTPFQLWLIMHEKNGYSDAVFLHTPNPQSEFPTKISKVDWEANYVESSFRDYFAPYDLKAGIFYDKELKQKIYILYSPSLGEKIE